MRVGSGIPGLITISTVRALILAVAYLLSLVGCSRSPDPWGEGKSLKVLVSFPPLYCFTKGVAYAGFAESRRGMIRAGYDADLTAFAVDLMAIDAEEVPRAPIQAVIVGGRLEYGSR